MRTAATAVVVVLLTGTAHLRAATYERVSVASNRMQGNAYSSDPAMTPDGRFVAFASFATNLVAGDTNDTMDIFVRDRATGLTTRENLGPGGVQANNLSNEPSISADGRFVAFTSSATNLVSGVTRAVSQSYVRDRLMGVTILVSASNDGSPGNDVSFSPSISANGRFVTFYSGATNFVPGDSNGRSDVFTRDLVGGAMTRDSVSSNGTQADRGSSSPSVSSDGRYVAFISDATNLAPFPPGQSGVEHLFVHDRLTGATTLESVGPDGAQLSGYGSISGDGRFIAIVAYIPLNSPPTQLYMRDRQAGQTLAVPLGASAQVNGTPKLSPDGRYLVFESFDRNRPAPVGGYDIGAYDRLTGQLFTLAVGLAPVAGLNAVAFSSPVALVADDTNTTNDVYVFGEAMNVGAPGPPSDLSASSSGSNVSLTWSPPSTGAPVTTYIIEAGSRPGAADLASFATGSSVASYAAPGVPAGTYYVRVRASNAAGTGTASAEVSLVVGAGCLAPTAPSNLAASLLGRNVTLTWAAGNGAASYLVLVGSGPGGSDILTTDLGSASTSLLASNTTPGTYFVRVQSINACGQSVPSNEVAVTVR